MNTQKKVVVGIGELLWDVFPDQKKAGGAPVNFIYHATHDGKGAISVESVGGDFDPKQLTDLD